MFENTKGLRISDIEKISDRIKISIIGGLNPQKQKFNNEHYQKRTYYNKKEFIAIISLFEKIERKINPLWSNLEKAMFVYKKLCEYLLYEESKLNGRDASRNLLGMIVGKSVCAGCAIIFKEEMDRIGIKCHYQNMQNDHAWNVLEIDGKYYGIDLTWDICDKQNNICGFKYFARQNKQEFYSDEHRNLTNEKEEIEYKLDILPSEEKNKILEKITQDRIYRIDTIELNGKESCNFGNKEITIKNNIPVITNYNLLSTYIRDDKTSFIVIPIQKTNNIYEYVYFEYIGIEPNKHMLGSKIFSETNFITDDYDLRNNIANNLLSKERVKNKINNFNGYVGYIEKESNDRFYNRYFEEQILNIYR